MNMNNTINHIINGDDNNNRPMKTHVKQMVDLLEELRFEFNHKIDNVLKPVYKKDENTIDVLVLPNLKVLEKLILVILRNKETATTNTFIDLTGCAKQAVNRSLNNLRNEGYVKKIKASTYAIANTNIY